MLASGRMFAMPGAFPKDFGISESCVQRWVKIAEIDDVVKPGVSSSEHVGAGETIIGACTALSATFRQVNTKPTTTMKRSAR